LVVAILSGGAERFPLRRLETRTVGGLLVNPPREPLWWVGRRAEAARLSAAGLRLSRPVPAADGELAGARLVPAPQRGDHE
ncbi:MAG TPA: hypothetical protein PK598_16045, partial [Thermoanaerobaculia bacterium]|nr:hypothetical protein [Thermoanaerobaculia bacterium]